jgi:hypothetical protein
MFSLDLQPLATTSRSIQAVRKIVPGFIGIAFIVTSGIGFKPAIAQAAKVDCAKVMSELDSGKKPREAAQDLKISTSSVYRCRRNARAAAKSMSAKATTSAAPSPMAAPSPGH